MSSIQSPHPVNFRFVTNEQDFRRCYPDHSEEGNRKVLFNLEFDVFPPGSAEITSYYFSNSGNPKEVVKNEKLSLSFHEKGGGKFDRGYSFVAPDEDSGEVHFTVTPLPKKSLNELIVLASFAYEGAEDWSAFAKVALDERRLLCERDITVLSVFKKNDGEDPECRIFAYESEKPAVSREETPTNLWGLELSEEKDSPARTPFSPFDSSPPSPSRKEVPFPNKRKFTLNVDGGLIPKEKDYRSVGGVFQLLINPFPRMKPDIISETIPAENIKVFSDNAAEAEVVVEFTPSPDGNTCVPIEMNWPLHYRAQRIEILVGLWFGGKLFFSKNWIHQEDDGKDRTVFCNREGLLTRQSKETIPLHFGEEKNTPRSLSAVPEFVTREISTSLP